MSANLTKRSSMKVLAEFLERMNNQSEHHVGYCGDKLEEIYDSLINEFSDTDIEQNFAIAYRQDRIVGAIGLDIDEDDQSAEVWGPFIEGNDLLLANELWKDVKRSCTLPITTFHFFLNERNVMGQNFVLGNKGTKRGDHLILSAKQKEFALNAKENVISFHSNYKDAFRDLHNLSFPDTYYSSNEILSRINALRQLFILPDGNRQIKGYAYVEADPEHGDGSIEYIAVSDNHRKSGIGTALLQYGLSYLFSYPEIGEITLSVGKENATAIRLYEAAGFKVKHRLIHYVIEG